MESVDRWILQSETQLLKRHFVINLEKVSETNKIFVILLCYIHFFSISFEHQTYDIN